MEEGKKSKKPKKPKKPKEVFSKRLLYEDVKKLELIIAENEIEVKILEFMREIYSKYITAKEISILLSAGKNIAYEEEDLLVFIRISSTRKLFVAKSLLNLIRIKNCHEVVLKNLVHLIEERKRNFGI